MYFIENNLNPNQKSKNLLIREEDVKRVWEKEDEKDVRRVWEEEDGRMGFYKGGKSRWDRRREERGESREPLG